MSKSGKLLTINSLKKLIFLIRFKRIKISFKYDRRWIESTQIYCKDNGLSSILAWNNFIIQLHVLGILVFGCSNIVSTKSHIYV